MMTNLKKLFFRHFFKSKRTLKQRESISWDSLCYTIRYHFENPELLRLAMTHRSSFETEGNRSNERLEFLGDAILGWIVTDVLFRRFPECDEGDLTRAKSMIVSRENLANQARRINLGQYLILGLGEERSGGRIRRSMLANAFEALLGAVYLDGGTEDVRRIIDEQLLTNVDQLPAGKFHHNYKSWLLEHVQGLYKMAPEYCILEETGPDHHKEFTVEVMLNGNSLGKGAGSSKKAAEQAAARDALKKMGILVSSEDQ